MRFRRGLLLLFVAGASTGCAAVRHEVCAPAPACGARGVVLVADGAGDYRSASENLRQAVAETCLPLNVVPVDWSHGFARIVADQVDWCHVRVEGCRLASQVLALRQSCPCAVIYLVGHSAGSGVVLTAAEHLPPGSVDRIILLSPSVSCDYDVRPALNCAREGMDVFVSERDWKLAIGVRLIGTADRRWRAPAGRVGFQPCPATTEDSLLYGKLRQHCWDPKLAWTGNYGRHHDSHNRIFLKAYVLPLLATPAVSLRPG